MNFANFDESRNFLHAKFRNFPCSLKHGDEANDLVVFREIFSRKICNSFESQSLFTVKISMYSSAHS